jgi:quinohemoprotein ethanol dehydrogenase
MILVVMRTASLLALAALAALAGEVATAAAETHSPGDVTAERLASADHEPGNWLTLGRDASQDYFSPLQSVTDANVGRLGFAWEYDLGTTRGQEATPIVVDGIMYTAGNVGFVYAVNAASGKQLWRFDPHIPFQSMRDGCCDTVNRGVAVWRGRVYVASMDGRLHALDAATGKEIWSVDTIVDHALPYTSSGAPIVAHDVVVIGNSGGDMGHIGARGYVSAYDLAGGALRWRFYTVPPAPGKPLEHAELARAAKTWASGAHGSARGGATVWDGMTYDPMLNLLYFGTGNAAPVNARKPGSTSGDLLFACSILAVNPDTGKMAWYYQPTPGDRWDYDATQKLVLADLAIGGQPRQAIMQANKNGFFYILDRKSGQLLSAKAFAYVTWASEVSLKTGRPLLSSRADFSAKPKSLFPSTLGAHSWQPMSFDPLTKLVYIPVLDLQNVFFYLENNGGRVSYVNGGFGLGGVLVDDGYDAASLRPLFGSLPELKSLRAQRPGSKLVREIIRAWDPVAQKVIWEHETSSGARHNDGGILSTAGNLAIQGRSSGELVAYAADTGKELASIQTGGHIMAAPITYAVNGVQYIAMQIGYGGGGMAIGPIPPGSAALKYYNENRILALQLDGGTLPMPAPRPAEPSQPPPASHADKAQIERGELKFVEQCSRCHTFGPSVTPDLRRLTPELHAIFNDIVLGGALAPTGMEKFDDLLSEEDVEAIHAYLIEQQRNDYAARHGTE